MYLTGTPAGCSTAQTGTLHLALTPLLQLLAHLALRCSLRVHQDLQDMHGAWQPSAAVLPYRKPRHGPHIAFPSPIRASHVHDRRLGARGGGCGSCGGSRSDFVCHVLLSHCIHVGHGRLGPPQRASAPGSWILLLLLLLRLTWLVLLFQLAQLSGALPLVAHIGHEQYLAGPLHLHRADE